MGVRYRDCSFNCPSYLLVGCGNSHTTATLRSEGRNDLGHYGLMIEQDRQEANQEGDRFSRFSLVALSGLCQATSFSMSPPHLNALLVPYWSYPEA